MLLESLEGHPGEQESINNFGLRNMKYVDVIKNVVDKACPGVVSCADILILSGRDGIAMVLCVIYLKEIILEIDTHELLSLLTS